MCHWRGAILQSFLFFSMILVFCFNLHYVIFTYFTLIRSIYIYILGDGPIVWRPNSLKVRYSEDPIVRRSDSLKARKSEDLLAWNQNRKFIFFYSDRSSINGLHPVFKNFQWIVFEYHDFSETHLVYWTFGLLASHPMLVNEITIFHSNIYAIYGVGPIVRRPDSPKAQWSEDLIIRKPNSPKVQ
jgi:hypothetical protein